MDKKGVSPLIATVLLIAFTVAVAGIISSWLTRFTTTTSETVGSQATSELLCTRGGISLRDLKFCSGLLNGTIENTRQISLGNLTLQIVYKNQTVQKNDLCSSGAGGGSAISCANSNLTLAVRDVATFSISAWSNYNKIRIKTNCTSVYDELDTGDVSTSC